MAEGWTAAGPWQTPSSFISRTFLPNLRRPSCRHWQVQLPGIEQCRGSQSALQPQCPGYRDNSWILSQNNYNQNIWNGLESHSSFNWIVFLLFSPQFPPPLLGRVLMALQRRWRWLWAAPPLSCVKSSPTPLLSSPGSKTALPLNPAAMSECFQVRDHERVGKKWTEYRTELNGLWQSSFTGGRTLQILNAKEEDAGRYTCVATNEAGETLKHYEVKVYGEMIWL